MINAHSRYRNRSLFTIVSIDKGLHEVDRKRKYDGGVLLRRYCVQRLQVTKLNGGRGLRYDVSSLFECPRRLLFALRCYHLQIYTSFSDSCSVKYDQQRFHARFYDILNKRGGKVFQQLENISTYLVLYVSKEFKIDKIKWVMQNGVT